MISTRTLGVLLAATASILVSAAAASADQLAPTWNCRASVLALTGPSSLPRFEPLVANGDGTTGGDRPACASDQEGVPAIDSPSGSPLAIHVQGPYSATALAPALGAARDQAAYAGTKTADLSVGTTDGQLAITATALRAEAGASCVDGTPKLDGSSTVVDLEVNGQPLPVDDSTISEITSQIDGSPLGGIVKVFVNQKTVTADSVDVQAVRIELLDIAGTPQATVVLGEAKASKQGDTCAPATTDNGGGSTTGGSGNNTGGSGNDIGGSTPGGGVTTTVGSSNPGSVKPVVINGRNGGCGRVKMWFDNVDLVHSLPGHRHRATSRFGNRAVLRGQLLNCKGKPIVGAKLDQLHYVGKGVGRLVKTGLKSRTGGKMTLILPMNLTTRSIVIAYRGNLRSKKITSRVVLHLRVRDRKGTVLRGRPPPGLE